MPTPATSTGSSGSTNGGLTRRGLLSGVGAGVGGAALLAVSGCSQEESPRPIPSPTDTATPQPTGPLRFPTAFLWGVATSAYQVEGAAAAEGRGPSVWDTFAQTPGRIADGSTGAVAADQYHRYREDVALMKRLGLKSYRFSVSWSRVMPEGRGAVNQKGLDYYRRLVDELRKAGIAPLMTLWHWDTPQALQDVGGWENREVAQRFADYAAVVVGAVGDRVHSVFTLNEPKTVVQLGYVNGVHAPGKQDPRAAAHVLHHLHLGHGLAVSAARAARGSVRIGPCFNLFPVYTTEDSADARQAAVVADARENTLYLEPVLRGVYPREVDQVFPPGALDEVVRAGDLEVIKQPVDLIGLNYYNPVYVDGAGQQVQQHPVATPATWLEIYPEGLFDILSRVHREYGGPELMITENGRPDPEPLTVTAGTTPPDDARISFLRAHLGAAHRALQAGVRLTGYQMWSLLDNFEWAEGYQQRWGAVHVDFATQVRTPKSSALWYQSVIRANAVTPSAAG